MCTSVHILEFIIMCISISIQTNCEIVWTPPNEGLYAVAVVLEDHIDVGGTTTYLSEVPLQFLIKVVEAKLPCNEKPEFVDTLLQPHCFAISEGDTFTYTVTTRHVNPNNKYGGICMISI